MSVFHDDIDTGRVGPVKSSLQGRSEKKSCDLSKEEKREDTVNNAGNVILYALIFVVAMGANDLANSMFSGKGKKYFLGRIIYVLIALIVALITAYLFKVKVNAQY